MKILRWVLDFILRLFGYKKEKHLTKSEIELIDEMIKKSQLAAKYKAEMDLIKEEKKLGEMTDEEREKYYIDHFSNE